MNIAPGPSLTTLQLHNAATTLIMATYFQAIPSTPPLAIGVVENLTFRAPAIAAGDLIDVEHLAAAGSEVQSRKQMRLVNETSITLVEMEASELRAHRVAHAALAAQDAVPHGMPPWAAAMQDNIIHTMTILHSNSSNMARNRTTFASHPPPDATLHAILKTIPGWGLGLPGYPHPINPNVPIPAKGDAPPNFPTTRALFHDLKHGQLSSLAAFYNSTFSILNADNLARRQDKFKDFICF
jgi:hypothetical protein